MAKRRVVIMGAAGRDFHNFNCLFRDNEDYEVVAFTATQIPDIEGRTYPPALAGSLYPHGIPIQSESELRQIVTEHDVDEVWFSYSDVPHTYVMNVASRVIGWGPSFGVCSAVKTMIPSTKPVIAVTAVRTGVGKSQTTRYVSRILKAMGKKVVAIRHPMPYGDLAKQACQRFENYEDLDRHQCTIEEREEYEPHIDNGFVVYAGVDYERILREAEKEADVILWDGGNNDTPFYRSDLHMTLVDPHRPGHELTYYPGETNLHMSHLLIVNKVDTADPVKVELVLDNCRAANPGARIIKTRSVIKVEQPELIAGKRALVVEDGPTLTHGGMTFGAGWFAARQAGAAEIVDARPYAVGSIAATYAKYPNAAKILPAMGYGDEQIRDLEATINATPADVVVEGTPIELRRILSVNKPIANVTYELEEIEPGVIEEMVRAVVRR
ncbi:MAG TPA: cyclic 2,3-diphosphoglycerate synthase [Thermoanaerobaculales bacterium]|nr:cyclic 2,3-diphosphoglycerate synthase [Thermoanaerobaculales bacterium]HPA81231.1 cyclic 2,3-diphosphoglycerate synthase [Thermoanaerobaculales bacterium]HQL31102.1 cyclic 2,3-diphosphoglycerate synthase [Thermoanaerobaculales bacterium]HQN97059.1 cyclic 2,3-diphosphoglycerate synthase [Thermoanaerobaculales bacterium]HQP43817.1 cyclic 2,3-diphosphoglycerate synthase [Thermoanaerobaculales bacterium]